MEDVAVEADNAANPTPVVVASVPSLIMLETWNQMMEFKEGKQQGSQERRLCAALGCTGMIYPHQRTEAGSGSGRGFCYSVLVIVAVLRRVG